MTYQPFDIGDSFRIIPPGHPAPVDGRLGLVMQRGAFGSGEHETTESCLEILESLHGVAGARVLDLGSGTGILAIAALKLGAGHAVCVDIDAQAVATARLNCTLNGLEGRATHLAGTLDAVAEGDFDLVLANIYGDILLDVAVPLARKVRHGGLLLLSGMLWEYNFAVRQAYEKQGFAVLRNRMLEEFSSLLLVKDQVSRQGG